MCLGARGLSVIKLAEHGNTTLDPVLRGPACQQSQRNHIIGGVAGGGQGALPLAGLIQRANIQSLSLNDVPLLSCGKNDIERVKIISNERGKQR